MIFILKLIGWLLLFLLCLVVFVVILALFVPIPYHLRLLASEDKPPVFTAWICGFQVFPRRERRSKKKKTAVSEEDAPADETAAEDGVEKTESSSEIRSEKVLTEESGTTADASAGQVSREQVSKEKTGAEKKDQRKKKKAGRGSRKQLLGGIHRELTDTGNRRAVSHAWETLLYLLKHFGPRRVKGELSFSLGDPAVTGYATAALSVCPFAYSGCAIYPDFAAERLYVLGQLDVRGHVRLIHALRSGLGLLLDKDIRKLIHKVRNR